MAAIGLIYRTKLVQRFALDRHSLGHPLEDRRNVYSLAKSLQTIQINIKHNNRRGALISISLHILTSKVLSNTIQIAWP